MQAQEAIFSRKTKKLNHPLLTFSKSTVNQSTYQKHLDVILYASVSFDEHLISVQSKTNKAIGFLRKLQNTLPRQSLIIIYKAFVRAHLDYGDIFYDQAYNASFHQKQKKNTMQCLYSNNRSYSWYLERRNIPEIGLRIS